MSVSVSIVEDDASIRQILADWINRAAGFKCLSVHDSAESALARLPGEKPAIVLTDINLPGQTGIECVRRLKPVMRDTQFVMLTVYEDTAHIFDALKAGASGYLLKRTPCDELIASLRQVQEGGSPMTSYIARKVVQSFHESEPAKAAHAEGLSPREREVLELLARGYFYKEITEALTISISTVNTHVRRIYEKLHVHSRAQAVAKLALSPATPGTGLAWANNLAVDGTIGVVTGVATNPTNILFSTSGGSLVLSWPADHLGWSLQVQTNSLSTGLSTNWVTIAGSAAAISVTNTIDPADASVFYRLTYP